MHKWSDGMEYVQEDSYVVISTCTWCGGHHEEETCPRLLATSGHSLMMADANILGEDIALARVSLWQTENSLDVGRSAVLAYENDPTVLSVPQQARWGVDIGLGYLEQDRLSIDQAVRVDGAVLSPSAVILQSSMASPQLPESTYSLADGPNVAFVGDLLTQACKSCGSVHIMAGSCPFEVTVPLFETYRHDAVVRLTPDNGLLLGPQAASVLPVADQGILTVDRAAIYDSGVGIYDSGVLTSQKWDVAALARPGVTFVGDVNCGSFHADLCCPSSLALAPHELRSGDLLSEWLSPERPSLSQVIMPSWREWPTAPAYLDAEFGDYLAARVGDAVYEAVASHGLVRGDLIVQVAILIQAESGPITQVGISYN